MDPLKTVGVILIVLLIGIAGHASFGRLGLAIGLLVGISLAVSLVRLFRTNKSRAVGPSPRWSTISDRRHQADHQSRRRA